MDTSRSIDRRIIHGSTMDYIDCDLGKLPPLASTAIVFSGDRLSFVGQDVRRLPMILSTMYGQRALALDLSFNQLVSLDGLERFTKLQELVLDNNQLSDGITIPNLPCLHTLSLNKNCIADLDDLLSQVARKTPELRYISLLGNPACPDQLTNRDCDSDDYQRYRYYVVYCLPKLRFLDSSEVDSIERAEAQTRGRFMRVMRPVLPGDEDSCTSSSPGCAYTPLPLSSRGMDDHQGAFGKCRYRYSGKHSEGNRFIQNSDL